jgi:hypothetical protein
MYEVPLAVLMIRFLVVTRPMRPGSSNFAKPCDMLAPPLIGEFVYPNAIVAPVIVLHCRTTPASGLH